MLSTAQKEFKKHLRNHEAVALWLYGFSYTQIASMIGGTRQNVQQLIQPTYNIRLWVRARAGDRCEGVRIGRRCAAKGKHIHHRSRTMPHNRLDNLELLCLSCHRLADYAFERVRRDWDLANQVA